MRSLPRRRLVEAILFLALALPTQGRTQTIVTEDAFLAVFDAAHPLVARAAEDLAVAEGERVRAGLFDNPTIDFEIESPDGAAEQATLGLGWQPPLDGRRGAAIDATEAQVRAARLRLEWAHWSVRSEMRAVYAAWAADAARRDLLVEHAARLDALAARLRARADRGEDSPLAAQRVSLAAARARTASAVASADLERTKALARTVRDGLAEDAVPRLPELVGVSRGEGVRPDLLALREEITAAEARSTWAGRVFEFPRLFVGWTRLDESGETVDGPVLGLSWNAPLFDRTQDVRVESARRLAVAESRSNRAARAAATDVAATERAYAELSRAAGEVADATAATDEVIEAATAAFLAGESSTTDLLDTLDSVLETRLAALDLHARALEAHRRLERNLGPAPTEGLER